MKVKYYAILFILSVILMSSYSQQKHGMSFSPIGYDSLNYDGTNEIIVSPVHNSEKCYLKVNYTYGNNTGTKVVTKTYVICGSSVTDTETEKGTLKNDDELMPGAEIESGPDGEMEIEYPDGSVIRLGKNSKFTPNDDICKTINEMGYMIEGKIMAFIKKVLGGAKYEVKTGTAYIGVRGTQFSAEKKINGSDTVTIVKVYSGTVEVRLNNFDVTKIETQGDAINRIQEDYKNGKITQEEMIKQMTEAMKVVNKETGVMNTTATVEAGYKCVVGKTVGKPELIETDDDRWFDDANFKK